MSMKKLLFLLLFILFSVSAGFGEGFPPKGGRDEYPIYWYLHRHGERLMKELNTRKFFRLHGWGCEYTVKITRDGDVIPLEVYISQNKYYDNRIKKIIATTKAEPFGNEIDLDEIIIGVWIEFVDWYDDTGISYQPHENDGKGRYIINIRTTH